MLVNLYLQNYLLIERLSLDFGKGLHIFTGETGSGKSIILEAIQGLISPRLTTDLIRVGADRAYLEGTFEANSEIQNWLQTQELEPEPQLILSREITAKGSRARLNGVLITAKLAVELGQKLLEIHGQNTEQKIIYHENQLAFLDQYAGREHLNLLQKFQADYEVYQALKKQIVIFKQNQAEREQRLDYLMFQQTEMETLNLQNASEEEDLKRKIDSLAAREDIKTAIAQIEQVFKESEPNLTEILVHSLRQLQNASRNHPQLKVLSGDLQDTYQRLSELVHELKFYDLEDQEVLDIDSLNTRLNELQKLRRKHNCADLGALRELQIVLNSQIEELSNYDHNLQELEKSSAEKKVLLENIASQLTVNRQDAADSISDYLNKNLPDLGLKGAQFIIKCEQIKQLKSTGYDQVKFLFQANLGGELKPLGKVASGGELSRLNLLLQSLAGNDNQTLLFDEIDAGTSGRVCSLIAEKLQELARRQQILCVTHQPLVAVCGDKHFEVSKVHGQVDTKLQVKFIDNFDQKIKTLVNLMSGEKDTISAKKYISDLITQKHEPKPSAPLV